MPFSFQHSFKNFIVSNCVRIIQLYIVVSLLSLSTVFKCASFLSKYKIFTISLSFTEGMSIFK